MIKIVTKGTFKHTESLLQNIKYRRYMSSLNSLAQEGVRALSSATPVDTGKTASSWSYDIKQDKNGVSIHWYNTNKTSSNTPIVILLQYGHATSSGYYVKGVDFINPAIKPIMEKIAEKAWKEVTK